MYQITLGPKIIVGADLTKKNILRKAKATAQPRQPKTRKPPEPCFSDRSRNNLIKALNGLSELPEVLLTLSYPDGVGTDSKQWKADLDRLNRRLKYQFPESWWIWRIEPQGQSGKPHYHIVGSTGQRTDPYDLWKWLQERWCRIVGMDPKKDQFATNVKEIKGDSGKLDRYISAPETGPYMEYREGWLTLTNRWGKMNRENIPVAALTPYRLGQETMDEVKGMVLASVQSQIGELEDKLGTMTNTTAHRDRITLKKAIKGKKDYMYRIRFRGDFFSILAPEHIELIHKVLEHRKANGTL
ncbi:MAG: inovirus Gp2 family protein [Proteobacteria bacterium]|nr:inovirus Gp2 family protein [Pseudomonadota bacterium]MBU1596547.1 inovirus Gp2 family protein [Pseudomonadota bacterium]